MNVPATRTYFMDQALGTTLGNTKVQKRYGSFCLRAYILVNLELVNYKANEMLPIPQFCASL